MMHTAVIKVLVSILADTVKIMNYLETSICLIYSDQMIQSFSGYEGRGNAGAAELGAGNARRVNVTVRNLALPALPGSFVIVVIVVIVVIIVVVETFSDFILYFITYISYSPYHTLL